MRYFLFATSLLFLASCADLKRWIPSDFDNVEFDSLASLYVVAVQPATEDWCKGSELLYLERQSAKLELYSKYRLNTNIVDVYTEIHSLASELYNRESPSNVYCKLKRGNIADASEKALKVFGGRK